MKLDKIHNTTNLKSCHSKFLQLLCSVRRPVIFCTRMEKYRAQAQARARGQIQAQIPLQYANENFLPGANNGYTTSRRIDPGFAVVEGDAAPFDSWAKTYQGGLGCRRPIDDSDDVSYSGDEDEDGDEEEDGDGDGDGDEEEEWYEL